MSEKKYSMAEIREFYLKMPLSFFKEGIEMKEEEMVTITQAEAREFYKKMNIMNIPVTKNSFDYVVEIKEMLIEVIQRLDRLENKFNTSNNEDPK